MQLAGTAFNLLDAAIRAGLVQQVFPVTLPHVPNYDASGVITEVGEGVEGWNVGDEVVAFLPLAAPGAAAEYVAAPAEALAIAPRSSRPCRRRGAALGRADGMAIAVRARSPEAGPARADQRCGRRGGRVRRPVRRAGRCHRDGDRRRAQHRSGSLVRRRADRRLHRDTHRPGARRATVRRGAEPGTHQPGPTPTSPEQTAQLLDLVTDGGAFVSTTIQVPEDAGRGVRAVRVFVRSDPAQLAELVSRVDAGALQIDVAERRPLADLAAVHAQAAAGRLAGRTVLIP